MTTALFRRRSSLSALVAALFAAGEQGLWYDIEGLRDAWNAVGPELLTNGDFSAGAAGWSLGAGISVSGGVLTAATASNQTATQAIPSITPGKWYMVTLTITAYTSGTIRVSLGGALVAVPAPALLGLRQVLVQAGTIDTNFRIYPGDVSVGGTAEFDNVSVREWLGVASCALYQDAAGSLPAYMPGQGQIDPPVGLLLDRRAGLAKGAELVGNGGFDTDLSGWDQSVANYWQWSAGRAYHPLGSNYADLTMAVTTTPGWVVVEFDYTVITGSGSAQWFYINAAGVGVTNASGGLPLIPTGSGRFRYVIRDGIRKIGFSRNTSAEFYVDNVTVRPLFGNHAYQTTTASRPTLSARYNLLTSTENLSDASWALGANWTASVGDSAPDGTPTAIKITSLSGTAAATRVVTATAARMQFTLWARAGTYATLSFLMRNNASSTSLVSCAATPGTVTTSYGTAVVTDGGNGWRKIVITATSGISIGDSIGLYFGATRTVTVGLYWWIWHPDLRAANDGVGVPDYQRVVDAINYDSSGFPLYLRFDGVDDSLQTTSVDFSGSDKAFIAASVRKISDAATGMIAELSADLNTSNGSFFLLYPRSGTANEPVFASKGTSSSLAATASVAYPAPISSIISGVGDISGDLAARRINGAPSFISVADQGAGSYGAYPLYIGRRGGATLPFNGRLYGLLIRGGAISDGQISRVERYLNQRGRIY